MTNRKLTHKNTYKSVVTDCWPTNSYIQTNGKQQDERKQHEHMHGLLPKAGRTQHEQVHELRPKA